MRSIADIDFELDAVRRELGPLQDIRDALMAERKAALPGRDRAIVGDFDAGHPIKRIAASHDTTVNAVWQVLRRAGRSARKRRTPVSHLPADTQRLYAKALRLGHDRATARRMAQEG